MKLIEVLLATVFVAAAGVGLSACRATEPVPCANAYTLVLIKTGPQSGKLEKTESQRLFAGHFANMKRMAEERQLLVAGPYGATKHDPALRGLFVLDTADRAQARRWAETDPPTQAGVFVLEYHDLETNAPLRAFLESELAIEAQAQREGRVRSPGEGGRGYVLLTAERADLARRELSDLVAQGRVCLLANLDQARAFAVLDAANGESARALLGSRAERIGTHQLDDWFSSGGLEQLARSAGASHTVDER